MTGRTLKQQPKEPTPAPSGSGEAEHRQLTVLFCDLVGSTRIAAELGPEDWREMLLAYQKRIAEVVERFDGTVAQLLGDGVLAYFGYPNAHEDDAERAVRAGLEIAETVAARAHELDELDGRSLAVRVGIHTGPVVVGGVGIGGHQETLAVGVASHLAARVQANAEPDAVFISAATFHLVRGIFSTGAQGPYELAGIAEPVELYRVNGAKGARNRLDVTAIEELTPFVGRHEEISLLLKSWSKAREGSGQVVLIGGEAGIGKSRLAQVFRERLADEPHRWIELGASKFHGHSAYYPLSQLIEETLQLRPEHSAEQKLAQLAEGLEAAGLGPSESVPLFASLLDLPVLERDAPLAISAEARRRRTLDALVKWLLAQAEPQPVVFVVEDLHWLDPSTLDVLGALMERASNTPILLLPTFRTGFELPWQLESHVERITLGALTPAQSEAMVQGVIGGTALPRGVLDQVVKKTDGLPLFVEEFTRTVIESGLLSERTDALPEFSVPATLQDSLMARLDRLGPAKALAQLASVLGRNFSHELLHAVSNDGQSLEAELSSLISAGILQQTGASTSASYTFKHALLQETAYGSLLKATRRVWHARVARVISERFAAHAAAEPERLAWHCEEGGLIEQAVDYYQKAGEQAALRSASAETIQHLTRGIELLGTLPKSPARHERELVFQLELGRTLVATKGWASQDAATAYGHARLLCERIGEPPEIFQVMRGLITFYVGRAELGTAHDLVRRLMELAKQAGESSLLLLAHEHLGILRYFEGNSLESLEHFEQAIALYEPSKHRYLAHLHGEDLGVFSRIWMAWALWIVGYPDRALATSHEALALGKEASHPFSLGYAFLWTAILHVMRREPEPARDLAEQAIAIAEEQGFAFVLAGGRLIAAWAHLQAPLDAPGMAAAADAFKEAVAQVGTTGNMANAPMMLGYLAEAYHRAGMVAQALGNVDAGLALSQATRQTQWDPELHRIKGELVLQHRGDDAEAAVLFQRALEIARSQGAKSLELRAALSLGRLWNERQQPERSRELLAPIYAGFTEGFDNPDLVQARELLGGPDSGGA
jgi:class 3 adenylate cyclase/tetratricopeptide (TPR) repeat protein